MVLKEEIRKEEKEEMKEREEEEGRKIRTSY